MGTNIFYDKDGKLYNTDYTEIYIPIEYFEDNDAINKGSSIETIGLLFVRAYVAGKEGPIQLLNIPTVINLMIYDFKYEEIKIKKKTMKVMTLKYLASSYVLHKTLQQGRIVSGIFLNSVLKGKLPKALNYAKTINIWWKNLEISGVSLKVPSKIYEMILASTYRNPNNVKQRFGEIYGQQTSPDGYGYKTGNVRDIVEGLSTFSGMVFEDSNRMITTAINNSMGGNEEPESPIEKIIYY